MRVHIRFAETTYAETLRVLMPEGDGREFAAFLLAGKVPLPGGLDLVVREVVPVPVDMYLIQEPLRLSINPAFIADVLSRADREGLAVIQTHSHPFEMGEVAYSLADDLGEGALFPRMAARDPDQTLASMVFGRGTVASRLWRPQGWVPVERVVLVGKTLRAIVPTNAPPSPVRLPSLAHHRQALALGAARQPLLAETTVAVVGLGGTGSLVFQQLAHLGVGRIIVIDPDVVSETNLSRVAGSTPDDAEQGRYKVEVAARLGAAINPELEVQAIVGSILEAEVAAVLREADVIFSCTDTVSSRMVLNRMMLQYLIPVIDLGIQLQARPDGSLRGGGGKVHVLLPDAPCLRCLGQLDSAAIGNELISGVARDEAIARGYISGLDVPQPAVIAFNGTVASLAVSEFLQLRLGFRPPSPWGEERLVYDLMTNEVRRVAYSMALKADCYLCDGLRARGDAEPMLSLGTSS